MRVDNAGVGIHVEVDGPTGAQPVVFLHGIASSARTFDWLPEEVRRGRQVVRMDLRGHGRSDRAPGGYFLEDYTSDVIAVLRHVTDQPVVLVGHSLGSAAAWSVAQREPALVRALFLEDPPLFWAQEDRSSMLGDMPKKLADFAADLQSRGADPAVALAEMTTAGSPYPPFPDQMTDDALEAQAASLLDLDPAVFAALHTNLEGLDPIAEVGVPTFVLAGEVAKGSNFNEHDVERLVEAHPGVRVVRVADAGHTIHEEIQHRATYVQHLTDFLGTTG